MTPSWVLFVTLLSLVQLASPTKILVQVADGHSLDFSTLSQKWNVKYVGPMNNLPSIHIFEIADEKRESFDLELLERNFPEGQIMWVEMDEPINYRPIPPRDPIDRDTPSDPEMGYQWHLYHTRADEAWKQGYSGKGVILSILDSGTNRYSSDLGNLDIPHSWNYVTEKNDPTPPEKLCVESGDSCSHGTVCANLAVGQANDFCGVGIAPETTLQGFLVLAPRGYASEVTKSDWADAQSRPTDISSNSYGSVACSSGVGGIDCTLHPHSKLDQAVAEELTSTGRDGKGTLILYASGNDGDVFEDTNIQGILTLRQMNAIGASTKHYHKTEWSCPGAGLLCIAPGESLFGGIVEAKKKGFKEKCKGIGSGTSWATPITAGAASVLLEANPDLTWRDFQHIIARSSYRQLSTEWILNSGGRQFSYDAGFGNLDLYAALTLASNWTSFPEESFTSAQNNTKVTVSSSIDYDLKVSTDLMVESINLILDISVGSRGGLLIELISPSGTQHSILKPRPDPYSDYNEWKTLSRGFWDERSKGTWRVRVTKDSKYEDPGKTTINSMSMTIYGTEPSKYPNAPELASEFHSAPHLKVQVVTGTQVSIIFNQTNPTTKVEQNELQVRGITSDWATVQTSSQSILTAKNLEPKTIYMFRGRSQVGNVWSEWGQVLTVKTKK